MSVDATASVNESPRGACTVGTRQGLLAIRRAAWPFERAVMRSQRLEALFAELAVVEAELDKLTTHVIERLYALIPNCSAVDKARLLKLKRAVFNRRALGSGLLEAARASLDGELLAKLGRYDELLKRPSTAITDAEETVLGELRMSLVSRVLSLDFQVGLAASSRTLSAALKRGESTLPLRDCRSLYAYVCRFATKANPLHVFSYFVPGACMRGIEGRQRGTVHEVAFDVQDILAIERRSLLSVKDPSRVHLAPRPVTPVEGGWQAWLKRDGETCCAFIPWATVLDVIWRAFEERRKAVGPANLTQQQLVGVLVAAGSDERAAKAAIAHLVRHGLLTAYLIDDLRNPARYLRDVDSRFHRLVGCLDEWHLKQVSMDALARFDNQLKHEVSSASAREPLQLRYHVNSYADDDLRDAEMVASELAAPLRALKGVLTAEGNFSPQRRVMRAFFAREVPEGGCRPYLHLLARFLRNRVAILDEFGWGMEAPAFDKLSAVGQQLCGDLEESVLEALTDRFQDCVQSAPEGVCFVGPFDWEGWRFFLTNVFTGGQVSVARYFLRGSTTAERAVGTALDVELAVPPDHNLNFVTRRFPTGIGFERRWAPEFRRWMEPREVLISVQDGKPTYRHAETGRQLRFHYRGLLQAQFLPVEYQLLLADHIDNYRNPFARDDTSGKEEVEFIPGLRFGPVCLRRDTWAVPCELLNRLTTNNSFVGAAVVLRTWMHKHIERSDLWFFRLSRSGPPHNKPRFLDLRNPLSTSSFRRAIGTHRHHVLFCRMEPRKEGLLSLDGKHHVSEFMVEV